jgi:HSP20 family protein
MRQAWSPHVMMAMRALPSPRLTADVYETAGGDAYVVEIPVPGRTPDEISIEATPDMLTVTVRPRERRTEPAQAYLQREQPIAVGPESRIFEFPTEIDTDGIDATLRHGILRIQVPKAAASRRKVIVVEQSA